jgi:hypothetical protein
MSGENDVSESKETSSESLVCDDCEQSTTWKYAVQTDPWGHRTGDVFCENCAEARWQRYQEYLMETT